MSEDLLNAGVEALLECEAASCSRHAPASAGGAVRPHAESAGRPGTSRAGHGMLAVARVDGASAVVSCFATTPLHLFTPRPRGRAVSAMIATHGGGIVAGDTVDLAIEVGPHALAAVATQAETKVYRSRGPWAVQRVAASVGRDGALAFLPEPTSCFEAARYRQVQRFDLDPGASLLLVDSLTPGRSARGERWSFHAYLSTTELFVADRLVLRDSLRLVDGEGAPVAERMRGFELLGTVVAVGPAVAALGASLLEAIGARAANLDAGVLAAASPLLDGVYLRVAARTVEQGIAFLRAILVPARELFGESALERC